jgi:ubiquinone/menaquinone biosynthesis C-methylase UbiE
MGYEQNKLDEFNRQYYDIESNYSKMILKGNKIIHNRFWIRNLHKYQPSGKLLDAGCGQGFFLKYAEKYYETFGIDISKYGISRAKLTTTKSSIQLGSISKLNYNDNSFDIVTSFDTLEHIEKPENALKECNRVLKNGGLLVISVPNTHSIGKKWKGKDWFGFRDHTHKSLLSNQQWIGAVQKSGFEIETTFYDGLWDSPYFKSTPTTIQHMFLGGMTHEL